MSTMATVTEASELALSGFSIRRTGPPHRRVSPLVSNHRIGIITAQDLLRIGLTGRECQPRRDILDPLPTASPTTTRQAPRGEWYQSPLLLTVPEILAFLGAQVRQRHCGAYLLARRAPDSYNSIERPGLPDF